MPGAYAVDVTVGNVPAQLIDGPPDNFTNNITVQPYILKYAATSVVGNLTAFVTRSLSVYDPCQSTDDTEFTCSDTLTCSVNGW